jgi:hypothetical protein
MCPSLFGVKLFCNAGRIACVPEEERLERQPPAIASSSTTWSRRFCEVCLARQWRSFFGRRSSTACRVHCATRSPPSKEARCSSRGLEQANLLISPLDEERHWYRYHALFAEILAARLRAAEPELLPVLHERAAAWHEEQGDVEAAVRHSLAASDFERARRLLRVDVFRYLMRGEIRTVRDWLDALPPDVLQADPALSTAFGWSLVLAGESEGVLDRVAAAERALATDPDAFDRMAVPSQLEALQARVAEMGGDLDASLVHTRAALDSIPGDVDRELGDRPGLRAQPELADAPGALDVAYARQVPVPCIAGSRVMVSVGTTVVDPVLGITNT